MTEEVSTDNAAVQRWRVGIENRAAGREHAITRGVRRRAPRTARGAYRAEGRTQCPGQMDIWDCVAEAEGDATEIETNEQ